ncbi:MAG: hypothetical protein GWM98_18200, partial [Nitrospinaceae bacterium]|nr:hypothetical protein [Nitrospinaceae bacterium]NIR56073.1 hypothetical protein [Nitrospinaceae bacterium]NIS86518.1 hypothetical protein [Nitrospinaceae bacterium]NIT83356.1 hypothetical protein [Nitrospinaceae bacterium]NIU45562.1 hypothetical protein [Nitrospinaceae bacterium]
KVVAERETGQVIGGQIVARRASELIPLVLLAIKKGLTVNALAMLSCGWNTQFQGIREAARDCVQTLKARP